MGAGLQDLNETHDPARRSFVPGANEPTTDFPLQNLPFGVVQRDGEGHCCVAIGDQVLDLRLANEAGLLHQPALAAPDLNPLLALGPDAASDLRKRLSALLGEGSADQSATGAMLLPMAAAAMALPVSVGSFTDFFTSLYHTERGGRLSNRNPPVPPAFRHLPIAYNSRATSLRVSGEAVRRPNGQRRGADGAPVFGPSAALDFELELGVFMGPGNAVGQPLHIDAAADRLWGYCLVNDWSSRDVQAWESDPLGPFLCKSFSTTLSPWVVTEEALRPFRIAAPPRAGGDPAPLPYLVSQRDQAQGGIGLHMQALLLTPAMRAAGDPAAVVTDTDFRHVYWTFAQMAAHHMSNGCNLQTGDLLASGTVSGPTDESRACMAELTSRGTDPVTLPGGEKRAWLLDGDEVIFRARAEREGFVPVGFGECRGTVAGAVAWPGP